MKKWVLLFLVALSVSGCAPFTTMIEENEKGGYNVSQSGKLPRVSKVEFVDEVKKQRVTIETDNKLKLLPTINASMFNFGGALSKEN